MPMSTIGALGRLARKLVNDSRTVQINGKILIASSSTIVGAMNSHAIARSDKPRTRRAKDGGVACAARSASVGGAFMAIAVVTFFQLDTADRAPQIPCSAPS